MLSFHQCLVVTALLLATLACAQDKAAPDVVRSYPTADGRHIVRHNVKDEGLNFDVPVNEVAYGNLTVTEQDDRSPDVGGMLTWSDFTRGVYGGQVYWAKWTISP